MRRQFTDHKSLVTSRPILNTEAKNNTMLYLCVICRLTFRYAYTLQYHFVTRLFCHMLIATVATTTFMGCSPNLSPSPSIQSSRSKEITHTRSQRAAAQAWNAGIVFPNGSTQVSFPLEHASVTRASEITAIKTSCECLTAIPRDYTSVQGTRKVAVVLTFKEHGKNEIAVKGVHVSIIVTIHTALQESITRRVTAYFPPSPNDSQS